MEGQGREGEEKREGEEQRGKKGERESLIGGSDLGMFFGKSPFLSPFVWLSETSREKRERKMLARKRKSHRLKLIFLWVFSFSKFDVKVRSTKHK